jgi:IclR family acetate operon transcriptional repressor
MMQQLNMAKDSTYSGRTIERALDVIECLRMSDTSLSLTEICRATNLHPATAHRVLDVLERRNYISRNARTRRYELGFHSYYLGQTSDAMRVTAERTRPALQQLASEFGVTACFGSREGTRVILLAQAHPEEPEHPLTGLERYVDAHASAIGQVLLTPLPNDDIRRLYHDVPLTRHTRRTTGTIDGLVRDVSKVRKAGFAIDEGELRENLLGLSVPLINQAGEINLAFWLVYNGSAETPNNLRGALARVRDISKQISSYRTVG